MGQYRQWQARKEIDRQLVACGWLVQEYADMNNTAAPGVAVRNFPLKSGLADFLLYVGSEPVGVIESKAAGFRLTGVDTQSTKYVDGLRDQIPNDHLPLPFAYESTGVVTQFTNALDPCPRTYEVFRLHRPDELRRILKTDYDCIELRRQSSMKRIDLTEVLRRAHSQGHAWRINEVVEILTEWTALTQIINVERWLTTDHSESADELYAEMFGDELFGHTYECPTDFGDDGSWFTRMNPWEWIIPNRLRDHPRVSQVIGFNE